MDGFYQNEDVMILAATNAYQYIPKPLLRSGWFDLKMQLSSLNLNDRVTAIKRFGDPYLDSQGIANHEVGHAIVNHFRAKNGAYIRLSIVSRMDSQGHLAVVDDQTGYKLKSDLENLLRRYLEVMLQKRFFLVKQLLDQVTTSSVDL